MIEHALGVKLTSSLLLVGRRICRFKFQTFTAWAALDCMNLLNHLWVSNRFCIKLQNTLSVNHKVEMLQNHKVPVLKDFEGTLQIKVSLIRSTFFFCLPRFLVWIRRWMRFPTGVPWMCFWLRDYGPILCNYYTGWFRKTWQGMCRHLSMVPCLWPWMMKWNGMKW